MMTEKEMRDYDYIVELGIATPDEINLVRNVLDGSWTAVYNAIIYARTGYHSLEQYIESEMEEEQKTSKAPTGAFALSFGLVQTNSIGPHAVVAGRFFGLVMTNQSLKLETGVRHN